MVYKVDRLTRSLADFAKLVELFDRHEVSFVSLTQAFNTTNSMGRVRDTRSIALGEGFSDRHVRTTANLALLAPDIVKAALNGRLPDGVGVVRLGEVGMDWAEQRAALRLV